MGNLKGMLDFLKDTRKHLNEIEEKLEKIQAYFNDNFANVNEIRRSELEFLQEGFFRDPKAFPEEISALFRAAVKEETAAFDAHLADLDKKRDELNRAFAEIDGERLAYFTRVKGKNIGLDKKEERLKGKVLELEEEIGTYNGTIDELNTGLGFITNFFRMRKIQRKKDELLEKRDGIIVEIEDIRSKWKEATKKFGLEESGIVVKWNRTQTELSMTEEKIASLTERREELIKKAAFVTALNKLTGSEEFIAKAVKAEPPDRCPRCKSDNRSNRFFCYYCGARFADDRPDVTGSLVEVGELNGVHGSLQEGIAGSVSILALMRGIATGVSEFTKSVESVKSSEDRYPLPKLKIDVPAFSREFAEKIASMTEKVDVKFVNLHPMEFTKPLSEHTEKSFTNDGIERFFTAMGEELNKTTKAQW
ncbi:MAG: hypothetical protein JW838_07165 [Spirochaetes bacterium]|nr:hypothetical protein [Spirochaetota bacterium]